MASITRLLTIMFLLAGVFAGGYLLLGDSLTTTESNQSTPDRKITPTPSQTSDDPLPSSPWEKETLVVAIENQDGQERNLTPVVADAIRFWETNSGYGTYSPDFRLQPNASNPDIIVFYNQTVTCSEVGHEAVGCAPVLTPNTTAQPPEHISIQYSPDDNRRAVRNVIIHEFGHSLGISHCDEPYWTMAGSCEEATPPRTDLGERDYTWRANTLSVYVDTSNASSQSQSETNNQIQHALNYYNKSSNTPETYPDNLTLVQTDSEWQADISIDIVSDFEGRDDQEVVQFSRDVRNSDNDQSSEFIIGADIQVVTDSDVDARGWYVGWALSKTLSSTNQPEPFVDASYRDRRSNWWD